MSVAMEERKAVDSCGLQLETCSPFDVVDFLIPKSIHVQLKRHDGCCQVREGSSILEGGTRVMIP